MNPYPCSDAIPSRRFVSFAKRIAAGVILAVTLPLALAFLIARSQNANQRATEELVAKSQHSLELTSRLQLLLVDMETGVRGFSLTGDEHFLEPYLSARKEYSTVLSELRGLLSAEERLGLAGLDRLAHVWRVYGEARVEWVRSHLPRMEAGKRLLAEAPSALDPSAGKRAMDEIRGAFDRLLLLEQSRVAQGIESVHASAGRLTRVVWGSAAGSSLLFIAGSFLLFRSYDRRARVLFAGIESAERGDYARISLDGDDELGRVAGALNRALEKAHHREEAMQQAIESAETARTQLDRFFSIPLDLLAIADFEGRFVKLNPAWSRLLGFPLNELVGRPFLELIHPDDREATLAVTAGLSEGKDRIKFENRYLCRDGSFRWLLWSATGIVDMGLIYANAHDITDRKRMEEELRGSKDVLLAANEELEAFSYSVSHDLRAPLRHIDGFSKLLEKSAGALLDEKGRHYLATISDSARRMGALVDDLLSFSRTGRTELRRTDVDLGALANEARKELTSTVNGRRVEWNIGPLPTVQGDPALLRQVLANLLQNAVKYTAKREIARIEVGCVPSETGETICFARDNGAGFDMAYAGKLFGVFQRMHRNEEFEGTGIGLANVKRIVERHGGRVWADAAPDKGASFFFSLPTTRRAA